MKVKWFDKMKYIRLGAFLALCTIMLEGNFQKLHYKGKYSAKSVLEFSRLLYLMS